MACLEVKLWSILTLRSVWMFSGMVVGIKLPTIADGLDGAGRGNCFRRPAETELKQLVGILFPGHWVPGLPGPLAGTVQPEGTSDGFDFQEMGTKMGIGALLLLGFTKPLKSPESSAGVGSVTGDCPTAFLYRS